MIHNCLKRVLVLLSKPECAQVEDLKKKLQAELSELNALLAKDEGVLPC